jgi:hypothetical protein
VAREEDEEGAQEVKLRIAKKVLKNPDAYTGQQRYTAAHRLYRRASTFKDGEAGFVSLMLKPQASFAEDEQVDLRFELWSCQIEAGGQPVFAVGEVVVPKENINKPVFRKDGQVHNFNALQTPGPLRVRTDPWNDHFVDAAWWEMGEWRYERKYSRKKYQIRTGGKMAGVQPKRLKRSDFNLDG